MELILNGGAQDKRKECCFCCCPKRVLGLSPPRPHGSCSSYNFFLIVRFFSRYFCPLHHIDIQSGRSRRRPMVDAWPSLEMEGIRPWPCGHLNCFTESLFSPKKEIHFLFRIGFYVANLESVSALPFPSWRVFYPLFSPPPFFFLMDGISVIGSGKGKRGEEAILLARAEKRRTKGEDDADLPHSKHEKREVFVAFLDWHLGGGGQSASSPHTSFLPSFRSIKNQEIWVSKMESRPSHNGLSSSNRAFSNIQQKNPRSRPPKKHSELLLRQGRHDDLTFPTQKYFLLFKYSNLKIFPRIVWERYVFPSYASFPLAKPPNRKRRPVAATEISKNGRGLRTQRDGQGRKDADLTNEKSKSEF